jgi:hypothetical protein
MNSFDYHEDVSDPHSAHMQFLHATTLKWLALKWAMSLLLIALAYVLVIPWVKFPLTQTIPAVFCLIMIYTAISSLVRIEMDADNFNRFLWRIHCALGPGRFLASTLNDTLEMFGDRPAHSPALLHDEPDDATLDDVIGTADASSVPRGGPVVELYSARFLKNHD